MAKYYTKENGVVILHRKIENEPWIKIQTSYPDIPVVEFPHDSIYPLDTK